MKTAAFAVVLMSLVNTASADLRSTRIRAARQALADGAATVCVDLACYCSHWCELGVRTLIDDAKVSIDVRYLALHKPAIVKALIAARRRGVRVRVIAEEKIAALGKVGVPVMVKKHVADLPVHMAKAVNAGIIIADKSACAMEDLEGGPGDVILFGVPEDHLLTLTFTTDWKELTRDRLLQPGSIP